MRGMATNIGQKSNLGFKNETWPTKHLQKVISSLPHSDPLKKTENPSPNWHNITQTDSQASQLAVDNLPEIHTLGQALRSEKKSKAAGGLVYRVLTNNESLETSVKAVIQYLVIWSRQRVALTIANFLIPIWILVGVTIYINTDIFFYKDPFSGTELFDPSQFLGAILDSVTEIWLVFLLCLWFFLVGVWNVIKWIRNGAASMRVLFGVYGVVYFIGALIEYLMDPSPIFSVNLGEILNNPNYTVLVIKITWIPLISILLSLLIFLLVRYLPSLRKLIGSHTMDYAPIFIYLTRSNPSSDWQKEVLFDKFHYCVKHSTPPRDDFVFVIEGRWHSFELYSNRKWLLTKVLWLGGLCLFIISVLISIYGIISGIDILEILEPFGLPTQLDLHIQRLLYPLLLIGTGYWSSTRLPTTLINKEIRTQTKLQKPNYYLSSNKLLKLWNLQSKEVQLTIKEKLEYPETYRNEKGELTWLSFYDEEMEEEKWVNIICELGFITKFKLRFYKRGLARDLVKRGETLQAQGKSEEALYQFEKATQLKPNYSQAWIQQADVYQATDRFEKAQNAIDIALQSQPKNAQAMYVQSRIFEKIGEIEKATDAFDEAKKLGYKKKK